MASPAVPVTLVGKLAARRHLAAGSGRRVFRAAWVTRLAAAAREHGTTVAAFGAMDLGAFQAWRPAGWITLGVSLLVFEWKVREPDA